MKFLSSSQGFTLIEILITVAIVGLLASIAVPTAELVVQRNSEHELRLALREIRRGLDAYKQAFDDGRMTKNLDESGYPASLRVLVDGVPDAKSASKKKIYFLRRIPRDPMSADAESPPEQTWGLRSYDSDADAPREGRDVYDVYSKSPGIALNRIPYSQW
jgi:general secretion pathway protein G